MSDSEFNLVGQLAEEFLSRLRQGEHPSIVEFAERYPEHADEIRELFPTLCTLEKAVPIPVRSFSANYRTELPIPSQLGDYRILRELSRGGMGIVYEAEQQALGRRVALKVLSASAASKPQSLVRFGREASAAGRLHHTNIVPVYDIGCEQGIHFYTMQLIQGTSLDEVIAQLQRHRDHRTTADGTSTWSESYGCGSASAERIVHALLSKGLLEPTPMGSDSNRELPNIPPKRDSFVAALSDTRPVGTRRDDTTTPLFYRNIARIGVQIADALAHAHANKLLHRDIKPSNVLLDIQGNVWVTDFGLAKDEQLDLTATGDLVGTLRYMAPERFLGNADIRSDIFSLGLTLYELLTLRSCLPCSDREIGLKLDAPRDLPAPRALDPRFPADLETIVLKAIEHDPRQRYTSAESMANDLRLFLADRPILARPVTQLERTLMWIRRNRTLTGTAAVAGILLILSCMSWIVTHVTRTQLDNAIRAETSALVHEHLAQATYYCASGRPGSRFKALDEIIQAVKCGPVLSQRAELRNAAITALAIHDSRIQSLELAAFQPKMGTNATPVSESIDKIAIASDYRRAAVKLAGINSIFVVELATQAVLTELPFSGSALDLSFSRSGALLAVREGSGTSLTVYKTETGHEVFSDKSCHNFDLGSDDRWLAIATTDAAVKLIDLTGAQPNRTLSVRERVNMVALSPDASRLAISYLGMNTSPVTIIDCDCGDAVLELDCDASGRLEWHPEGKRLAIATWRIIELWDVETRVVHWSSPDQQQTVGHFGISPDGRWLLANYWDNTARLWDLNSRNEALRLERPIEINWNAENNLPGWRTTHSTVELIHFERSPILMTLPTSHPMNELPGGGAFSPDGQRVIASTGEANSSRGYQRKLEVIDLSSRRRIGQFEADLLSSFNLSTDGTLFSAVHGREWSRFALQANTPGEQIFGPPASYSLPADTLCADICADGSTCAILQGGRLKAFRWEEHSGHSGSESKLAVRAIVDLPLKHGHDRIRISPDGKWAASGFWHSPILCVWDLAGAKLHRELELGAQTFSVFTPDSQRLVTSRWDAYRFWDLPGLTNKLTLPRVDCALPDAIAFDETGQYAVMPLRPDAIDVVDLRSSESRLHLHRPGQGRSNALAFHPQAAAILIGTHADNRFALWDLRALNVELSKLGLGLDNGPVEAPTDGHSIKRVSIVGLDGSAPEEFIGALREDLARETLLLLEESYRTSPTAIAANDLAWALLMAPKSLRDPPRALELAKRAIRDSEPAGPAMQNTLATAYYRNGKFKEAIEALSDNLAMSNDNDLAWDLFVISLSHAGLGNLLDADHYFRLAQRWSQRKSEDGQALADNQRHELDALRAEAQAALDALRL